MDYYAHYNDALGKFAICDQEGTILENVPQEEDAKIGFCQITSENIKLSNSAYYNDIKNIQIEKGEKGSQMMFFKSEKSTYCVWDNEKSAKIDSTKSKDVEQFKNDCKSGAIEGRKKGENGNSNAFDATIKAKGLDMNLAKGMWNDYMAEFLKSKNKRTNTPNEEQLKFFNDKNLREDSFKEVLKDPKVASDPYAKAVVEQLRDGVTEFDPRSKKLKEDIKDNIKTLSKPTKFTKAKQIDREQTDFSSMMSSITPSSNRSPKTRACSRVANKRPKDMGVK